MPDPSEQPASKQDLIQMEARLKDTVQEMVRDAQTEILRGFERFSRAHDIRLRKLEADYSNLNTSETIRIGMLEERVTSIERKMILDPPRPQ